MGRNFSALKKSKSFISFLFLMFVGIFTMFTFSACKLTNSNSSGNASFDSSGNLKIVTPIVDFNKYSTVNKIAGGNTVQEKVVDEKSGSFSWVLQYYYSGDNKDYLKNIDFDQDYLFANFFKDSSFTDVQTGLPSNNSLIVEGSNKYFTNSTDKYYSPALMIDVSDISYPSFEVVVDGNYFTFQVCVNTSFLQKVSDDKIAEVVGDRSTQLKNIFVDKSYNYEDKRFEDQNGNEIEYGSLFTFKYRTGKNNNGEFIDCPKGVMSYYVNEKNEFCIRFNPQLEAGSVNRYMKVKALAIENGNDFISSSVRGNSNYSSTRSFEAYALSFEAYSPNSATLDYGGLEYDEEQYYFAYKKTYYNSADDSNPIKTLTGYFPEGRKVVVSRTVPAFSSTYDYSLQNWTINTKAENSYAYGEKLPGYVSFLNENLINSSNKVISNSTLELSDAFQIVDFSNVLKDILFRDKSESVVAVNEIQEKGLVYCYSPTGDNKYSKIQTGKDQSGNPIYLTYDSIYSETKKDDRFQGDQIVVTSHNVVNGYKFYANYSKVRNFMMSGTMFAGDNFFTSSSQYLEDYSLTLFFKNVTEYVLRNLSLNGIKKTETISHRQILNLAEGDEDPNPNSHPNGVTVTIDGSYFKVVGLEIDDFIVFQKEGQALNGSSSKNLPYSFHSPLMKDKEALGGNFRALDLVESSSKKADRQDVGIIGTQYAESSNLEINLYRVSDTKNSSLENVPSSYLDLLKDSDVSYEVIKSVSSYEDESGYITTNVILSLILPSNATLTGYNLETFDIKSMKFFSKRENGALAEYVMFTKYNPNTMKEELVDIDGNVLSDDTNNGNTVAEASKSQSIYAIKKEKTSKTVEKYSDQYVYYEERLYFLDHTEVGGYLANIDGKRISIYKTSHTEADGNDYFYLIKEDEEWYELTYTKTTLNADVDKDGIVTYKVGGAQIYELDSSGEAYRVSTTAKAYLTEMEFINPNDNSEKQDVYVYYDVEKVGNQYFYVAPIGKRTTITSVDTATNNEIAKIEDVLYFEQISNFSYLLRNNKIMLGSSILSSTLSSAVAYRSAVGSRLILNCYYYIPSVGYNGSATELSFMQYLDDGKNSKETLTVVEYYDKYGKLYTGNVVKDSSVLFSTPLARDTSGAIIDTNLPLIDTGNYWSATNKELKETKTIKESATHGGDITINESSFTISDGTVFEKEADVFKAKNSSAYNSTSGYGLTETSRSNSPGASTTYTRTITLWEFEEITVGTEKTGRFVKSELYFDGANYHKIIAEVTVKVGENYKICKVYDKANLSFSTDGNNYIDLITVTSSSVTGTLREAEVNGSSVDLKKNNKTTYKIFVTDYITEYNGENIVGIYYPTVLDSNNIKHVISDISIQATFKFNYKTDNGSELYSMEVTKEVNTYESALHRHARKLETNVEVTVLGKYTTTNDTSNPKIYPSFSSFLTFDKEDAFILERNSKGKINYYSMDYTTKKNVIEGFPGVTLLAGIPYPNPVLSFTVKHKSWDTPVVNIALEINNGYYVEVMGTKIATDETNLVRDFTTYSFKETIENLLQNDYIDNAYWVLDQRNFNPVSALILGTSSDHDVEYEIGGVKSYYKFYSYTTIIDKNNNTIKQQTPLTIQNLGLNENDSQIYASGYVGVNQKYYLPLYFETIVDGKKVVKELTTDDVVLWNTSASTLSAVPSFDIHTYIQGTDGMIYFTSGTFNDDNIICNGLSGITAGSTQSADGYYDYSEVMISGVTHAYRTLKSQLDTTSFVGYQFDKMINILNAFDSTDPYFLTGKESAVFVASPIVKLNDNAENSYVYRFKEWRIFSRYNSEVLYYNRGVTENLLDRTNAILRFSSNEAGYFVVFPVYERVFEINTGSAVIDGALNKGGSVNIYYEDGEELDVESSYDDELFFVDYEKTTYSGKEGYFYGNLTGFPFLYYTGEDIDGKQVYQLLENVYVIDVETSLMIGSVNTKNESVPLFFQLDDGKVTFFKVIQKFSEGPGIILLENNNGQYYFSGFDNNKNAFENDDGFKLKDKNGTKKFYEIINTAFTADFFYDEITKAKVKSSVPVSYDVQKQAFNVLNIQGDELVASLLLFNLLENSFLFESLSLGKLIDMFVSLNESSSNNLVENFLGAYCQNNNLSNKKWVSQKENGGMLKFSNGGLEFSIGDKIANYSTNKFTVIKRVDNPYVNGMYLSRLGSLTDGELATDKEGKIYSTQQFKTAYFDRDSHIVLQAIAPSGYRFEGWYACEYDKELGYWFTTDKKVENSENIYSDEIIQAYFNPIEEKYYYITDSFDVDVYHDIDDLTNAEKDYNVYIYYFDSDKTQPAVVPDRMLDKVRGFFINHGTEKNPNYIQVFRRAGGIADESYYYDSSFINPVDTTIYEVEVRTFIESIRVLDYGDAGVFYYLSGLGIYKKEEEDGSVRYYRNMTTGNIVVDGDKIEIKNFHSNLRFVAKFIETYNEYIFAEDEDASGITIQEVYYSNYSPKIDADGKIIIRSDLDGNNKTFAEKNSDEVASVIDPTLFSFKNTKNATTDTRTILTDDVWNTLQTVVGPTKTSYNGYDNLKYLTKTGFGATTDTYKVNKFDESLGAIDDHEGKLNLQSMYFDVGTTVHIVVRVEAELNLSIHSLGMNSKYILEPIFGPTDDYISANQKLQKSDDNRADYYYYVFKVTYDRNPENKYVNYIVHPDRGDNMAYDVISGNYVNFYSSNFVHYDNDGEKIDFIENNGKIKLTQSYVQNKIKKLDTKVQNEILDYFKNTEFDNIEKALREFSRKLLNPERLKIDYVKFNGGNYDKTDDIYNQLQDFFETKGVKYPYLLRSGQRNFINLSTTEVYNYTVQTVVIDSEGDNIEFEEETNKIILPTEYASEYGITDPVLKNSFHTAGGTNEKSYIGGCSDSSPIDSNYQYIKYGENNSILTTLTMEKHFDGIPYAKNNTVWSKLEDLPFMQNTIILFDGIKSKPQKNDAEYQFVGWYEQKFNNETLKWSDPVFMGSSETEPYLSLATSDTVVVAVYKRVVELTIKFNENEMDLELENGMIDSLGNPVKINKDDAKNVTLNGKFYFDSKIGAILSPAGGFRFKNIDDASGTVLSERTDSGKTTHNLKYYNYNQVIRENTKTYEFVECKYEDAILNSILKVEFSLNELLRNGSESANLDNQATLNFNTERLTLVYVKVVNFYLISHNYNFILKSLDGTETFYKSSGNLSQNTDSTHSKIHIDQENNNLVFYGYFDKSLSGKLILETNGGGTGVQIRKWYINRDSDDVVEADKYSTDKVFNSSNSFRIEFEYEGENAKYNSDSYYSLNKDNDIYYIKSIIEGEAYSLEVDHNLFESLQDLLSGRDPKINSVTFNTTLSSSFKGKRLEPENLAEASKRSGSWEIASHGKFEFVNNSTISLNTLTNYVIDDGNLYVFVGWFMKTKGGSFSLITDSSSINNQTANGHYVACYVRAVGVTTNAQDGSVTIENSQSLTMQTKSGMKTVDFKTVYSNLGNLKLNDSYNFNNTSGQKITNVTLVGSSLKFTVNPYAGKKILSCTVFGNNVENEFNIGIENTEIVIDSYARKYTTEAIPNYNLVTIKPTIGKGFTIKLTQTLFETIKMEGSGTKLQSSSDEDKQNQYVSMEIQTDSVKNQISADEIFFEHVVFGNSKVTLRNNHSELYYFIGFFIGDRLVSTDEGGHYLQRLIINEFSDSVVVEARYTRYVYVGIQSLIDGTSMSVGLDGSPFLISYTDPRTGNSVKFSTNDSQKTLLKAPSGISATVSVTSNNSFNTFICFRNIDLQGNYQGDILSTKQTMNIPLDFSLQKATVITNNSYTYGNNKYLEEGTPFINFACVYQKTISLSVSKNIVLSENQTYFDEGENKNIITEQLQSMFNVSVSYVDISGEERTISMSNTAVISGIRIKKGSSIKITPSLSSAISHRYSVYDFEFKLGAISHKDYVSKTNETFEIDTSTIEDNSVTSLSFTIFFRPSKAVTIAKEVIGESQAKEDIVVEYSYKDSQNIERSGRLSETNETDIFVKEEIENLKLTASAPIDSFYHFVGWFADGILISEEKEIDQTLESVKNANSLIAKFIKVVNLEVSRNTLSNGTERDDLNLKFSITASFVEIQDGKLAYQVQTKNFEELKNSEGIKVLAGSKIFIFAEQDPNFTLSFVVSGSESSTTFRSGTNNITLDGLTSDSKITLTYEEKTSPITYLVSTTNSKKSSGDGLTLSDVTTVLTPGGKISFTASLNDGYEIDSIAVLGQNVEFERTETNNISIEISEEKFNELCGKNIIVEIKVKKKVNVNVYVAFDGFSDLSYIVCSVSVGVKIGNVDFTLSNQIQNSIFKATNNLILTQNLTTIEVLDTLIEGTNYKFDGFYLYDGNSTATSVSPITFQSSFTFAPFDDFSVVAKFESTKKPSSVSTTIIGDNGSDNFAGWFARVNSTTSESGFEDILVSTKYEDKDTLKGKFDQLVANYFGATTSKTVSITGTENNFEKSGHAIVYASTSVLSEKIEIVGTSTSFNLNKITSPSSIRIEFVVDSGFDFNSKGDFECSIKKLFYENTISAKNNQISKVETKTEGVLEDTITINGSNDTFILEIVLQDSNSSANVNILKNGSTDFETTILSSGNSTYGPKVITIGSSAFISIKLAIFEKMIGFNMTINGENSQFFSKSSLRYVFDNIDKNDNVKIVIVCADSGISTIVESDIEKGSANITENNDGSNTIKINTFDGFLISEIKFAEIDRNGVLSSEKLTLTKTTENISNFLETKNEPDSFGDQLLTGVSFKYDGSKNLAFYVTYEQYSTINFNVLDANETKVQTITKYLKESDAPLTLAKIDSYKLLEEKVDSKYQNHGLKHFSYKGVIISNSTEIFLVDRIIEINLCLNKQYQLVISIDADNNYNSNKAGLQVVIGENGDIIAQSGSSRMIFYSASSIVIGDTTKRFGSDTKIHAIDKNEFYVFKGFYADSRHGTLISSSADYIFRIFDIESCGKIEGTETYVLYAVFEEITQSFIINRDFPSSLIEAGAGLSISVNGVTVEADIKTDVFDGQKMEYTVRGSQYVVTLPVALTGLTLDLALSGDWTKTYYSPLHKEGTILYDFNGYRFFNFYDQNETKLGEDYSNTVSINIDSNLNESTITAKLIKIHKIEFSSSNLVAGMKLTISAKKFGSNDFVKIVEKTYNSSTNFSNSILSCSVEEGTQLQVSINFNIDGIKDKFTSIVVSNQTLLTSPLETANEFKLLVSNETTALAEVYQTEELYMELLGSEEGAKYKQLLAEYNDVYKVTEEKYRTILSPNEAAQYKNYLEAYNDIPNLTYDVYSNWLLEADANEYKALLEKEDKNQEDKDNIANYQQEIKTKLESLMKSYEDKIRTQILSDMQPYIETIKTNWAKKWEDFYSNNGFVAVSKRENADVEFNQFMNDDYTSTYNFSANEDLAFIADFSGNPDMFKLLKKTYITSSLWTTINKQQNRDLMKLNPSNNNIHGNGFIFNLSSTNKNTYYVTPDIQDQLSSQIYVLKTSFTKSNEDKNNNVYKLKTSNGGVQNLGSGDYHQLNFNTIIAKKATFQFSASQIVKNGSEVEIRNLASADLNSLKFTDDTDRNGKEQRETNGDFKTVTITANEISGYYFKGFALVSSNYDLTFEVTQLNGLTSVETMEQYNFLIHNVLNDDGKIKFSATFKYSGDVEVVAIYEPTVYIVTLNTYKYYEDNEQNKLNKDDKTDTGNPENDREKIDAGKIKGSLLALHGTSIKITSINYQFSQFVGFTGIATDSTKDIWFGYDFGEGLQSNSNEINNYFYGVDNDGNKKYVDKNETLKILTDEENNLFTEMTGLELYKYCLKELNENKTVKYENSSNAIVTLTKEDLENKFYRFKGTLSEDRIENLYPGEYQDGKFVSTASRNNFYALNVQQNFTLNLYYTNLFYKIIIDLAETESTIQYTNSTGGNDKGSTNTESKVYLAYSDEYTALQKFYADKEKSDNPDKFTMDLYVNNYLNNPEYKFKNPSAGTYTITKNYGTTDINKKDNVYSIIIKDDDPYVYVWNDNNNKSIGYPTKVSVSLIEFKDEENEAVLIKDVLYSGTTTLVQIATATNEKSFLKAYANPRLDGNGGDLKKYAFNYNVSDVVDVGENGNSDIRPTLRNILNYLDAESDYKKLIDGLFTIKIKGIDGIKTISSNGNYKGEQDKNMTFDINISKGTARVIYKVVSTGEGFAPVEIQMFDKKTNKNSKLPETVIKVNIENETKTSNKQTKAETTSGDHISGFNMGLFSDESSINDPKFDLGNIDVNLTMTWQTLAKPVEAIVSLEGSGASKEFILTGLKSSLNNEVSYGDGHLNCKNAHPSNVDSHDDKEIRAYFIIIIKNGYTLVEMIKDFLTNGLVDEKTSQVLLYYLLTAPFGMTDGYGSLYSNDDGYATIGNGATGSLFFGSSDRALEFYLLYKIASEIYGADISNLFTYRVIDAYELYSNNINGNFFNNAVNSNDIVVTQCVLQEHEESQVDHRGGWLGWLWTADKGYSYYNSATGYVEASKNNGSYSTSFTNSIDESAVTSTDTGKKRNLWDKIVGWFDNPASFAGTYNRFITAGFAASDKDLMENSSIIVRTKIDKSKTPVVSREYDYNPVPITNQIFFIIETILLPIALNAIPGIGLFVYTAYSVIVIADCIWVLCDTNHRGIVEFFANMW